MKQKYCLAFLGFYLSFLAILLNSSVIFAQSTSVLSLGLTSVGSSSVPPNIIFLETKELRPTFKGTAPANSSVTVEIEGNSNTTKAGMEGQWEWTPLQDLKSGEFELKISSGAQNKLFRLKVLPISKALDSRELSTNPVSSPKSIFEQDVSSVSQPTSSPVTTTSTPSEEGFLTPLQNYLPFILGAFAIGILLFIISRLLKPKSSIPPPPPAGGPPPPTPSPELNQGSLSAQESVPSPLPGGGPAEQTTTIWQPSLPDTPSITPEGSLAQTTSSPPTPPPFSGSSPIPPISPTAPSAPVGSTSEPTRT